MTAEDAIKAGNVEEALGLLRDQIRKAPADARLRRFLFQINCLIGEWEKALTQLQVLAEMDAESQLLAEIYRPVIACEMVRAEVFQGKRTPLIFGEPQEWLGWIVQANQLTAEGHFKQAREFLNRALESAPAAPGTIDGTPFAWLADADSRLGPILEVILDGKYHWVPMDRIAKVTIEAPTDLRNLVWISAKFTWMNGGETAGLIPTRYAGTESSKDGALLLARKTDWVEKPEEYFFGLGQRMLSTDAQDFSLLEVRSIEFTPTATETATEPEPETVPAPPAG